MTGSLSMATFKEATDALRLSAPELAALFGLSVQTVRQMRMDPGNPGFRSPPDGWERKLAPLAEERGSALRELAEELGKAAREA
jgi:hypothetical protein